MGTVLKLSSHAEIFTGFQFMVCDDLSEQVV